MIGKEMNAFYFLHYRAWELLVGSLMATLPAVTKATGTSPIRRNSAFAKNIGPKTGNWSGGAPVSWFSVKWKRRLAG
jgi:hypothetical protein